MKQILFILVLGLMISCGQDKNKDESEEMLPRDSIILVNQVSDVMAVGKVQPDSGISDLSSSEGGVVTEKFINEGDTVTKNQVLVSLKNADQQNQLAQLNAQIKTQQEKILSDELELDQYKIKIIDKENTLATSSALAEKGAETVENVQTLQTDIALLESNRTIALQKIKVDQSQLNELKIQYATARSNLADRQLRSPIDGKVIDVDLEAGEVLQAYTPYASLIPFGHLVIWGEADELFANKLKKGQEVSIKYIGYPDTIARGRISYLSPVLKSKSLFSDEPGEKQDRLVRRFKVILDGSPELLINAKVQCIIKLRSDVADRH